MKKRIFALLAILTLLLAGCGNDDTTVFDKVNTIDGVTLTLKEDTLKASKATFVLKNDSNRDVEFDPTEYHLETKKDDVWRKTSAQECPNGNGTKRKPCPQANLWKQQWSGRGFAAQSARVSIGLF